MSEILATRVRSRRAFPPGEELLLALALATSDLGGLSVEILEAHGLTHPRYNVLRMLRGAGERGLTYTQVTRLMITGVPDVTRMMDRLEEDGHVRRDRDPADRRRVLHRIEPAGLALLEAIEPEMQTLHDWIERALPADRREALVELCEEVIQIAAARSGRDLNP